MKKKRIGLLGILLALTFLFTGCVKEQGELASSTFPNSSLEPASAPVSQTQQDAGMKIGVVTDAYSIVFQLNNSSAAISFYQQLPLTLSVENYSSNEKIFYPPEELDVSDTPLAKGGPTGTLAYYAPWGDVVLYYGDYSGAAGLYELGQVLSGAEQIKSLSGEISIDKIAE